MKGRFGVGLCVWTMLSCAHKENKPEGPVIKHLRLEGTKHVSRGDIEDGIATTATGWWPFAERQHFDPVTWQTDQRRIERIYEAHGFFQAEVVKSEVKPVKGGVDVKATIEEGEGSRIGSVEVQGLESLPEREQHRLMKLLGLKTGDVFIEQRWKDAHEVVRQRLRDLGYAQAGVQGRALIDVETHRVALLVLVRPGELFHFGDVEIRSAAHARINPLWVKEQVRLAIAPGELYSDEALAEAQRRVFAMGVFALAKVTAGRPDPSTRLVPVIVDVGEAPFRTLRAGGGIHVDQIRNEARLRLEWVNLDFLGGMRKLSARAEAGWAFIPNVYAVARNDTAAGARNGPIVRTGLQLEQPRFLYRPSLRAKTSLEGERTLEQTYDAIGARLSLGLTWQIWSTLSVYSTYNLHGDYVNGPPIASVNAAPLTLGCATSSSHCFILLSYLEQGIVWDKRDSPLEARNGWFASLSVQEGGGPLGGDFSYVRVLPDVRGYVTVANRVTFASRLRLGELVHGGAESAVVTRFFAGGGVSMRGFSERRLSPLLIAPAPSSTTSAPATLTLPIGGNGLLEGNFEMRFRLSTNLVFAVFMDFGQVTRGTLASSDLSSVLWAAGFGFRYRTPVGPVRIDLARRLPFGTPPPLYTINGVTGAPVRVPYAVNDSCFGIGGSGRSTPVTDSLCAFHIAIGEDF
jgi:translocation and assembly module TamA